MIIRRAFIGAAAVVMLGTAGCAGTPSTVAAPVVSPSADQSSAPDLSAKRFNQPELATNPFDAPDSEHKITYSANFVSEPFPLTLPSPAISAEEAIQVASRDQNFGESAQPGDPQVVLRMVAVGDFSGSIAPVARPAWVLTWANSFAIIHGPIEMTEADRDEYRATNKCEFVVAIDASTGVAFQVNQICVPK